MSQFVKISEEIRVNLEQIIAIHDHGKRLGLTAVDGTPYFADEPFAQDIRDLINR